MGTQVRVTLIRHGETDSNVRRQLQGWLNSPLNATGQRQARRTGALLRDTRFDRAFVSSLSRCRQTSAPILSGRPSEMPIDYRDDLWEKNLGELEGLEFDDARAKMAAEGKVLDDYGEGQARFAQRLLQFWDAQIVPLLSDGAALPRVGYAAQETDVAGEYKRIAEDRLPAPASDPGGDDYRVLIVTHGGCVATLGRELTGARGYTHAESHAEGAAYMVPRNCSITELVLTRKQDGTVAGKFLRFGDAAHVGESGETLVGADAQIGKAQESKAAL